VIVGGAGSDGTPLASTEIYNPRTNTWATTGALTTARASHTATLLPSGRILVAGGLGSDGKALASAEVYNPATGTWSATGALSTARSSQTATLLVDGTVLAAGGTSVDGTPLALAEVYDPSAGTWSAIRSMPTARSAHTATPLGGEVTGNADTRVLVTGGVGSDGRPQTSADVYDPRVRAWIDTGELSSGRSSHTATLLPNGFVLVDGGVGPGGSPLASGELFNPATGRWSPTAAPAGARSSHTATVLLNGRVLVAGGAGPGGATLDSAELYEPDLGDRWQTTASLTDARSGHTATLLPAGEVLVAGGHTTTTAVTPPRIIDPLSSAELFRPAGGTWTKTSSLGRARSFHTATLLRGPRSQCGENCGKVLVAGGIGAEGPTGRAQTIASAELYDPATDTWSSTGSMTTARAFHSATPLPDGKVLVVAGAGPGGAEPRNANQLASAELYDPLTGTWTATGSLTGTTTPPASNTPRGARLGHSASLLDRGNCADNCGKVLIAGGVGGVGTGPALSSAELYDPSTGTFRATASLGELRQSQAAAPLPDGRVLVVGGVGGFSSGPPNLNTAEAYSPATETWSPVGSLSARRLAHTATPLSNGRVLVVGGAGGGNASGANNVPGPGLFSSESFDPQTNTWRPTSFLNTARVYHTATLLPDGPASVCGENCGKVLVAGGNAEIIGTFAPYFDLQSPLRSAELYTPPQTGQDGGKTNPGGATPPPGGATPPPGTPPASRAGRVLELDASRTNVRRGAAVQLRGRIDGTSNPAACQAGQPVELQRRAASRPTFVTFARATSDQDGNFATTIRPRETRRYRALVRDNDQCLAETSNPETVAVPPVVTVITRSIRLDGRTVRFRMRCPRGGECEGTVKLRTASKVGRPGSRRRVTLGTRAFQIPGNDRRWTGITVTRRVRSALRTRSRVTINAFITSRDTAGHAAFNRDRFSLRIPSGRK